VTDATGLHFDAALLPEGWAANVRIHLAGRLVERIEHGVSPHAGDERGFIALPGIPNLHSHAFQRAIAGVAEHRSGDHGVAPDSNNDNFWTWRSTMYRYANVMTPEGLEAVAAQAYAEMLESGFTRVCEFHYIHHDTSGYPYVNPAEMSASLVRAAAQTGIGLTLLPVFYAHGGFGGRAPGEAQRRFTNTIDQFAKLLDACRSAVSVLPDPVVGIAPHSLRAITPRELADVLDLAHQVPVHMHVAETQREVAECVSALGARPVEWLLDNVDLDSRWCIVHATHLAEDELARLARSSAVAGLCPITEANLGDGVFPARQFHQLGGMWLIGSDSNVLIDAFEELRLLEYGQRLWDQSRNRLALSPYASTGRALFDRAVVGGSTAAELRHSNQAFCLMEGASADIICLSGDSVAFSRRNGDLLLDSLIFTRCKDGIESIWRAGRKVVAGGRHVDRERIRRRYLESLQLLIE
jgi:formimidoylglutamate deiminase